MALKVYLGGPDVFLAEADHVARIKLQTCCEFGFEGLFPLDNGRKADRDAQHDPHADAARIFHANCSLLHAADIGLFNLTPFRGPSADVGTVFELAFLFARGKPVCGYSASTASYRERVQRTAQAEVWQNGSAFYPMGDRVEDFGLADNLMILQAIEESGGSFTAVDEMKSGTGASLAALAAFRACVQLMRTRFMPVDGDPIERTQREG
jgi:nucleoside 2-deoxyribosyltransferase